MTNNVLFNKGKEIIYQDRLRSSGVLNQFKHDCLGQVFRGLVWTVDVYKNNLRSILKFQAPEPNLRNSDSRGLGQDSGVGDGAQESALWISTPCDSRAGGLDHLREACP